MHIGKALVCASKFVGKEGKIWLVGQGGERFVFGTNGPHSLRINSEDVIDGVQSFDTDQVLANKAPLDHLGRGVTIGASPVSSRYARFVQGDSYVDLEVRDGNDIPAPPDVTMALWTTVPVFEFEYMRRIALLVSEKKEDRPGLAWLSLGPLFVDATDEVIVATAPSSVSFEARVPGAVLQLFPYDGSSVDIARMLEGSVAIRTEQAMLFVDGRAQRGLWFPDLRRVWQTIGLEPPEDRGVKVVRTEIARVVRAATSVSESAVITLVFAVDGVHVLGGMARTFLPTTHANEEGELLVSGKSLGYVLQKGSKNMHLKFRGTQRPLEVIDGNFRALVFPVIRA